MNIDVVSSIRSRSVRDYQLLEIVDCWEEYKALSMFSYDFLKDFEWKKRKKNHNCFLFFLKS